MNQGAAGKPQPTYTDNMFRAARLGLRRRTLATPHPGQRLSLSAIFLRVLLCLGLLVNGWAQAVSVSHAAASAPVRVSAPPCHEHGGMTATAHPHGQGTTPLKKPDCCKSGACACACSHGVVTALPAVYEQARDVEHAVLESFPLTRYASPALPRLIRPPIA